MKASSLAVLNALRERGPRGLSDLEALEACGTSRLAARIWDLRAEGYVIEAHTVTAPNGKRFSRYVLVSGPAHGWGHPAGSVRECPSCKQRHAVGTACAARAVPA